MTSAADQVFGIAELREKILSELTFYDLFTAQRVNRSWRDCIKSFCTRQEGFNEFQVANFLRPQLGQRPSAPRWLSQRHFRTPTEEEAETLRDWEFDRLYHDHSTDVLCGGCSPFNDGARHPAFEMRHLNPILRDKLIKGVCWRAIGGSIVLYVPFLAHLDAFVHWCRAHRDGSWMNTFAFQPSVRHLVLIHPNKPPNEKSRRQILHFRTKGKDAIRIKHLAEPLTRAHSTLYEDPKYSTNTFLHLSDRMGYVVEAWQRLKYRQWNPFDMSPDWNLGINNALWKELD